jgi:hypothetical protein
VLRTIVLYDCAGSRVVDCEIRVVGALVAQDDSIRVAGSNVDAVDLVIGAAIAAHCVIGAPGAEVNTLPGITRADISAYHIARGVDEENTGTIVALTRISDNARAPNIIRGNARLVIVHAYIPRHLVVAVKRQVDAVFAIIVTGISADAV